jgi:hypothetical protein
VTSQLAPGIGTSPPVHDFPSLRSPLVNPVDGRFDEPEQGGLQCGTGTH